MLIVVVAAISALLTPPVLADRGAPGRSASASGSVSLSLTIPPRPSIRPAALCTETTSASALLRVTDASGDDLPRCDRHTPHDTQRVEPRASGIQALLVAPV